MLDKTNGFPFPTNSTTRNSADLTTTSSSKNFENYDLIFDTIRNNLTVIAVIIESDEKILDNLKSINDEENDGKEIESEKPEKILLITFDSNGLQTSNSYDSTSGFLKAVKNLKKTSKNDTNIVSSSSSSSSAYPTLRVMNEIVDKNFTNGTILLITGTKPKDDDDEGSKGNLMEKLKKKNLQVHLNSILL
ncbi:hypothetical protein Phum_PHUM513240 [Pediculus humanus corporis]|uniref:Uncharacterized protein n=1 Tax=Pediculus humanus subsp. corporis TaxID=121224 RepID=E0VYE5_PEDHC|nr:uncharacterized protein Phum_PHUM513240 [Pediculus humanus corporis]EEB18401.1 hypothetical protein Phum_PHUM513240 [Pediculus humanus corporis]